MNLGKIMRGFVFVDEGVLKAKKQLEYWVKLIRLQSIREASKKPAKNPKRKVK
jgi:hypothetical protein